MYQHWPVNLTQLNNFTSIVLHLLSTSILLRHAFYPTFSVGSPVNFQFNPAWHLESNAPLSPVLSLLHPHQLTPRICFSPPFQQPGGSCSQVQCSLHGYSYIRVLFVHFCFKNEKKALLPRYLLLNHNINDMVHTSLRLDLKYLWGAIRPMGKKNSHICEVIWTNYIPLT